MSTNPYQFKWRQLPSGVAHNFNSSMNAGTAAAFPISYLPSGHQRMDGLQLAYCSGYHAPTRVADGITGVGELVLVREDGPTWKAYNYPVGCSGTQTFVGAEFKYFSGHHFPSGAAVPMQDAFGNVPWPR